MTRQVAIPNNHKPKNGGTRQVAIPNPALTCERGAHKRAASAGRGDRLTASAASSPEAPTQKLHRPRQTRHTRQSRPRSWADPGVTGRARKDDRKPTAPNNKRLRTSRRACGADNCRTTPGTSRLSSKREPSATAARQLPNDAKHIIGDSTRKRRRSGSTSSRYSSNRASTRPRSPNRANSPRGSASHEPAPVLVHGAPVRHQNGAPRAQRATPPHRSPAPGFHRQPAACTPRTRTETRRRARPATRGGSRPGSPPPGNRRRAH